MAKKLWSWALVKANATGEVDTIHMLHSGSAAFLLAGMQTMGELWRWDEGKDRALMDEMEALLGQSNEDVMTEIDFCALVAQCQAASGGSSPTGGDPENELPPEILGENMLPDDYSCDNDHAFGMANTIVDSINDAVIEVFQLIELKTNALELTAEVADNVPIVSAAFAAAEFVLWVQETIYEEYVAAWSVSVKDEIACELYCAILDDPNCSLSFDTIWDVYASLAGIAPPLGGTFTEFFDWIVNLQKSTNVATVKVAGLFGLTVLRFGSIFGFFGLGVRSLETVIQLAADDTNPDWSTLCDACPAELDRLGGDGNADMTLLAFPAAWPYNTTAIYVPDPIDHYRTAVDANTPTSYMLLNVEFAIPGAPVLIDSCSFTASIHVRRDWASYVKLFVDDVEKFNEVVTRTDDPWVMEETLTGLGTGSVVRLEFRIAIIVGSNLGGADLQKLNVTVI